MQIVLTQEQWRDLKRIVALGAHAERRMSPPIELSNGAVKVEIKEAEVNITLTGEE